LVMKAISSALPEVEDGVITCFRFADILGSFLKDDFVNIHTLYTLLQIGVDQFTKIRLVNCKVFV